MKKDLQNILMPVDFNELTLKAAKYTYHLAKKIHANIVLLYVMEISGVLLNLFSSGNELVKQTDKIKEDLQLIINESDISVLSLTSSA